MRKDQPHVGAHESRDLHPALLHQVNAVALIALLEDFLARGKLLLAGDLAQGIQLRRVELAE